jgi:hypothetical protein
MWRPLQPGTLGKGKVMAPAPAREVRKGQGDGARSRVMAQGGFEMNGLPNRWRCRESSLGTGLSQVAESESSGGRTRTCDPTVNSRLLYQLSYAGKSPQREEKTYPGGG